MNTATISSWDDLEKSDLELYRMLENEKVKQLQTLELGASSNYISPSVLQCMGSCFNNSSSKEFHKYSEGSFEKFCETRCLKTYGLDQDTWGADVRAYSCTIANLAVYMALCNPGDRIMGFSYNEGGHHSHGHMISKQKLSAASIFYETVSFKLNPKTGLIDYDKLEEIASLISPKTIVAGICYYSRNLDYVRLRDIADKVGAFLVADMAHVAGLVAAKLITSPFDYCDVVTTSTYKTLRGPQGAVIFYKKRINVESSNGPEEYDLETRITKAVFPGIIGGSHINTIASIATAMNEATTTAFKRYQTQILLNAKKLCSGLSLLGYDIITGGTDNHMVLIDLRSQGVSGLQAEYILERVNITSNAVYAPGDGVNTIPNGLRLGTPAITTRGMKEIDINIVINFIDTAINLTKEAKLIIGSNSLDAFKEVPHDIELSEKIKKLKYEVSNFAETFPIPTL